MSAGPPGAKLLVVDDEESVRSLICRILHDSGYDVESAVDGKDALDKIAARRPDLIVLDLMMPEVSGFDVVDMLKDRKETAAIPVVVVTAKTLTEQDKATLHGLVAAVLQKSAFDRGRFVSEVRRAIAANPPMLAMLAAEVAAP